MDISRGGRMGEVNKKTSMIPDSGAMLFFIGLG